MMIGTLIGKYSNLISNLVLDCLLSIQQVHGVDAAV